MRLYHREFEGLNGQGSISIPGAKAGDILLVVLNKQNGADRTQYYERILTVDEQLKQVSNSDQSSIHWVGVFVDPSSTVG